MTIEEILTSNILDLPILQNGNSFIADIENVLNNYIGLIDLLNEEDLNIPDIHPQQPWAIKSMQRRFITDLIKVLNIYYDGHPADAFNIFSQMMDERVKNDLRLIKYKVENNFYRIRKNDSNYLYPLLEMFHVPFEKRGIIDTKRYSIPGFPSLYLGTTIYSCWEEMQRPNINEFQACRFQNIKTFSCLNLVPPLDYHKLSADSYSYLITWPLIAACSISVKQPSDFFKPEYIIPQLLLQWVRKDGFVQGIRYNSIPSQIQNKNQLGDYSNIVLPIKQTGLTGHCPILKSMFRITNPISWQIKQYAMHGGGGIWIGSPEEYEYLDEKIPNLELIEGRPYKYSATVFGQMEYYLDSMNLNDVE